MPSMMSWPKLALLLRPQSRRKKKPKNPLGAGYIDSLSELAMSSTSRILRPFTWRDYLHFSSRTPYSPDARNDVRDRATVVSKLGCFPEAGRGSTPHLLCDQQATLGGKVFTPPVRGPSSRLSPKNRRRLDLHPLIRKPGVIRKWRPIWPLLRPHTAIIGARRVHSPPGDKWNPVPHPQVWSPYPRVGGLAQVVRSCLNPP
jgi:hypothetical protein